LRRDRSLTLRFAALRLASRRHSSLGFASPGFAALLAWPRFATLSLASRHSSLGLFAWLRVVVLLGTPRPGRRATWHVFVPLRLTPEALRSLRRPSRRMTLSLVAEGGVPNSSPSESLVLLGGARTPTSSPKRHPLGLVRSLCDEGRNLIEFPINHWTRYRGIINAFVRNFK